MWWQDRGAIAFHLPRADSSTCGKDGHPEWVLHFLWLAKLPADTLEGMVTDSTVASVVGVGWDVFKSKQSRMSLAKYFRTESQEDI